ncbi:MAG: 50S ribosomal protein L21 [Ruminococcaceae bacterium]|nr:50S ribosomal protein L21 [Oscillospiraceae bacterium]
MYAILQTGGKQYKVQEGDILFIEKLNAENDSQVTFDSILAVSDDNGLKIGEPTVAGATVVAKVIKSGKEKKIKIFKYKPKKGYRRRQGHRQPYTKIQIEAINA